MPKPRPPVDISCEDPNSIPEEMRTIMIRLPVNVSAQPEDF